MRQIEREELTNIAKGLTEDDRGIILKYVPDRELFDEIERRFSLMKDIVSNVRASVGENK